MSSTHTRSPLTNRFDPSELSSTPPASDDWPTAIQLEDTIEVSAAHTSPELRGLLTPMSITRVDDTTLDVYDGVNEHRVDVSSASCSCHADHGGYCQHVWHILHRAHRGLIASVVDIPPEYITEATTPDSLSEDASSDHHNVVCSDCGEIITSTEEPVETAHTTLCADCLLTADNVKHFAQTPGENPVIVFIDHQLNEETVASFYPRESAIPLYEFFSNDDRVTPSDTPIAVRELQYDTEPDEAFQFEHTLTFVPAATLTTPTPTSDNSSVWVGETQVADAIRNPTVHSPT